MSHEWQFSTPEGEGMDSSILNELDHYIKQKRYRLVNSVLIVKNGKIVFERYYNGFNEFSRNNLRSVWKSILSITTGICFDKGLIKSLDEPICNYLPEFGRNIHPYHKSITIHHLLTMSSGIYWNGGVHYHCPMMVQMRKTDNWADYIADIAMSDFPGNRFMYKEWDVILLSAVIGKACGGSSYDIASELLYSPLGIKSGKWAESPCGIAYTIIEGLEKDSDLSARDMAKIGLLFHNNGMYGNNQIVSSAYVREVVNPSLTNPGYGYLWWLFQDGYGCRGFGGQRVNVVPDRNFISVIQATPTPSSKSYDDINESILKKALA